MPTPPKATLDSIAAQVATLTANVAAMEAHLTGLFGPLATATAVSGLAAEVASVKNALAAVDEKVTVHLRRSIAGVG